MYDEARRELCLEHEQEMQDAVESFMIRHDLHGDDIKYDLLELYDLGYDHGSTIEASFPS